MARNHPKQMELFARERLQDSPLSKIRETPPPEEYKGVEIVKVTVEDLKDASD